LVLGAVTILLKNNFIRIIDHNVLPSVQNLEEFTYCKWHNSFDHNTSNCNVFCRVIQSAIDNGRLRFSEAQHMDQLDSIGLDGKQVSNRLALLANSPMEPTDQESHLGEPIATIVAESAQPPLGTAKPTPAVSETAKPTQWSAKPSGEAAVALPEVELARPAQEAAKPTLLPLEVLETAKSFQDTAKPPGAPLVAQEKDMEPSSDDKVVVHQLQVEDILVDDNVTTISEDTRGS
jgi:hypothetical protein